MFVHRLETESLVIIFEVDDSWCRVWLGDTQREFLGAESLSTIRKKLIVALTDLTGKKIVGTIKGLPVFSVISLMEMHATFYVANCNGDLRFFIQNADAKEISTFVLTPSQRDAWRDLILRW